MLCTYIFNEHIYILYVCMAHKNASLILHRINDEGNRAKVLEFGMHTEYFLFKRNNIRSLATIVSILLFKEYI